jgi:DNA-binding transcriptional MocR family regulator
MVERGSRREADAANGRDALRAAILNGQYLPGERLVEAQLCEDLGISRFNVRAALQDLAASGPAALAFAEAVRPYGAAVTVLDGPVGAAAEQKLLRSVFYEGLAAAVVEALEAAKAAGRYDWRTHEMAAAADLLDDLGVPARIARASRDWLDDLASND